MRCHSLTVLCFLLAAQAAPLPIPDLDASNYLTSPVNLDPNYLLFPVDQQANPLPQVLNTALAGFPNLSPADSNTQTVSFSPTGNLFPTDNLFPITGNQLAEAPDAAYYADGCDNPNTCKIYTRASNEWVYGEPNTYTVDHISTGKICPSGGTENYKCVVYYLKYPTRGCGSSDDCQLCTNGDDNTCEPAEVLQKPVPGGSPLQFVCPKTRDGNSSTCVRLGTVTVN